ncbi:MAG: hypothetical protein H6605_03880 [Flavobacteriales bacterium]|nr:hypothetical protein [Flavobacteriales bacterium]
MSESGYFNPFPGLRSFEEEEEYLFFGREKQVDELLSKLGKTKFLAVIGASGSGKSSLVKSGLLPALHSGFLSSAGSGWRICTLKPGNDPVGNLAEALSGEEILGADQVNPSTPSIIESILRRSNKGISETIRQLSEKNQQNVLIVVDQFEELFRFSKYEKSVSKGTRDAIVFINLLLEVARQKEGNLYIVFTMRSDFLGDCTEFRGLPEAINQGQYLIPRMTREERKAAITGPIAVGGAQISQSLLTRLLNDVGDNPDQLPILQHALMRTWDYWAKNSEPDSPLDLKHYEAIGTMSKALSLHAEEAYAEIEDPEGQEICEKLFRFLTEKREDGRGVRHPGLVRDIRELTESGLDKLVKIIEVFRKPGRSFLMPPTGVEINDETIVDISHESLMRVWERLQSWVQEEIESAELYIRLAQSAELYQEGKTGLWRDPELMMAIHWKAGQNPNAIWAKRYDPSFDRAMNYLDHSVKEKERELKAEEQKRKAAIFRLRMFVFFVSLACIGAIYFAYKSYLNANVAEENLRLAEIEQRKADSLSVIALYERDQAKIQKDSAESAQMRATESEKEALLQKAFADNAARIAEDSARAAKVQRELARKSAKIALDLADSAETQKSIAIRSEQKAIAASNLAQKMRLRAEANNLAIKSRQIIQDPSKDQTSLELALLSYGLNKIVNGPAENRIIYNALKDQLTKSYIYAYQERKDKQTTQSKYDERSVVFTDNSNFYTTGDDGIVKHWQLVGNPVKIQLIDQSKRTREKFNKLMISPEKDIFILRSTSGNLYITRSQKGLSGLYPINEFKEKSNFVSFLASDKDYTEILVGYETRMRIYRIQKENLSISLLKEFPKMKFDHVKCFTSYGNGNKHCVVIAENSTSGQRKDVVKSITLKKSGNGYEFKNISEIPFKGGLNYSQSSKRDADEIKEGVSSLSFNSRGDVLAIGGEKGTVLIYKFMGSEFQHVKELTGNSSGVTDILFSNKLKNEYIITSAFDHTIHVNTLADSTTEELVFRENQAWIRSIALSEDNKNIVSVGQGGHITIWPANLEILVRTLYKTANVQSLLEHPNLAVEGEFCQAVGTDLYKSIVEIDPKVNSMNKFWFEYLLPDLKDKK